MAIKYNWTKLAQNGMTIKQIDLVRQYLGDSPSKLFTNKKFKSPREIYDGLFTSTAYPKHYNPSTTPIPEDERTNLLNAIILLSYFCSVNKEMYDPCPDDDIEGLIEEKLSCIAKLKRVHAVNDVMANALYMANYHSIDDLNDHGTMKLVETIYSDIVDNNILSVSEAADIYNRLYTMRGYYLRNGVVEVGPGIVTVPPR